MSWGWMGEQSHRQFCEETSPAQGMHVLPWTSETSFLLYFLSLQSHLWIFPGLPDFHSMQRSVLNLIYMQLEFLFLHF